MDTLISVIVPVYNSSPYLHDCIQSVLQQTYQNFELILVDDGSEDDSKNICQKLSITDRRIHYLTQSHKGVSAARNKGIKAAIGRYLFFLDSDDMIHPYLLETMYTILSKTNAVMAATEYSYIESDESTKISTCQSPESYSADYIHVDNQIFLDLFMNGCINSAGGIMIHHISTHFLHFDERLQNGEDTKFIYQMLLHGTDGIILNQKWYYYRKHKNNSSKKRNVRACQSIYNCECYIRNSEIKQHRLSNALLRDQFLIARIGEWYITGHRNHDATLCTYLKKLSIQESTTKIFSMNDRTDKIKFFLIFHCLPLYNILHALYII